MRLSRIPIIAATAATALFAQTETRGIVPEEVLKARPQPKSGAVAPKPQYQPIGAVVVASLRPPSLARQVGVTIWRLRHASPTDFGARILVQEDAKHRRVGARARRFEQQPQ